MGNRKRSRDVSDLEVDDEPLAQRQRLFRRQNEGAPQFQRGEEFETLQFGRFPANANLSNAPPSFLQEPQDLLKNWDFMPALTQQGNIQPNNQKLQFQTQGLLTDTGAATSGAFGSTDEFLRATGQTVGPQYNFSSAEPPLTGASRSQHDYVAGRTKYADQHSTESLVPTSVPSRQQASRPSSRQGPSFAGNPYATNESGYVHQPTARVQEVMQQSNLGQVGSMAPMQPVMAQGQQRISASRRPIQHQMLPPSRGHPSVQRARVQRSTMGNTPATLPDTRPYGQPNMQQPDANIQAQQRSIHTASDLLPSAYMATSQYQQLHAPSSTQGTRVANGAKSRPSQAAPPSGRASSTQSNGPMSLGAQSTIPKLADWEDMCPQYFNNAIYQFGKQNQPMPDFSFNLRSSAEEGGQYALGSGHDYRGSQTKDAEREFIRAGRNSENISHDVGQGPEGQEARITQYAQSARSNSGADTLSSSHNVRPSTQVPTKDDSIDDLRLKIAHDSSDIKARKFSYWMRYQHQDLQEAFAYCVRRGHSNRPANHRGVPEQGTGRDVITIDDGDENTSIDDANLQNALRPQQQTRPPTPHTSVPEQHAIGRRVPGGQKRRREDQDQTGDMTSEALVQSRKRQRTGAPRNVENIPDDMLTAQRQEADRAQGVLRNIVNSSRRGPGEASPSEPSPRRNAKEQASIAQDHFQSSDKIIGDDVRPDGEEGNVPDPTEERVNENQEGPAVAPPNIDEINSGAAEPTTSVPEVDAPDNLVDINQGTVGLGDIDAAAKMQQEQPVEQSTDGSFDSEDFHAWLANNGFNGWIENGFGDLPDHAPAAVDPQVTNNDDVNDEMPQNPFPVPASTDEEVLQDCLAPESPAYSLSEAEIMNEISIQRTVVERSGKWSDAVEYLIQRTSGYEQFRRVLRAIMDRTMSRSLHTTVLDSEIDMLYTEYSMKDIPD